MAEPYGSLFKTDQPMDVTKSRGFVLKGVDDMLQKGMGKANRTYKSRGFGSGIHAPSLENTLQKPYINQAAETGRKALTDLYYKDEQLKIDKMKAGQYYDLTEGQIKNNARKDMGGKVLCTELYRQGLLSFGHIKADLKFLKNHVDKNTHENYLRWAVPLVEVMRHSRMITLLVCPFVRLWSGYMKSVVNDTQRPVLGWVVHRFGIGFGKLYKTFKTKRAVV